jgi:hypothetical protein
LTSSSAKGNVLVGFGFDLDFHFLLAQAGGQDDLLGDDRRRRQGHGHELGGRAHALPGALIVSDTASTDWPDCRPPPHPWAAARSHSARPESCPLPASANSTIFTAVELISTPISGRATLG